MYLSLYIHIYTWLIFIYTCDHRTLRLLMMGEYGHPHASLLLIMASAKKDVRMTEDMSRYAQYLQQPARCATLQGFEKFPQLTVIKDFWRHQFPPHLLRCARYLEPVILALSRIWTEMDSMREHRLLRFKLLRRPKQTETNQKWINNLKGSNRCFYILLVISFLVISCHFEGLYGFWGWNLTFVWTDELGHVLACSDILLNLIRFLLWGQILQTCSLNCTILINHTNRKWRKRFYHGVFQMLHHGFTLPKMTTSFLWSIVRCSSLMALRASCDLVLGLQVAHTSNELARILHLQKGERRYQKSLEAQWPAGVVVLGGVVGRWWSTQWELLLPSLECWVKNKHEKVLIRYFSTAFFHLNFGFKEKHQFWSQSQRDQSIFYERLYGN